MSFKALERHLQPLLPFLKEEGVTEICINKPQEVYVEKQRKFIRFIVDELELGFLESLAALIAEYNHKAFSAPLLSGSLPSGERIQFVMHPACEGDKLICSIRKHQLRDMTLDDYEMLGAFKPLQNEMINPPSPDEQLKKLYDEADILGFLKLAIASRKNMLISGGTGTGKTTFLNACLKLIPETERIITVEDTREVNVSQPNAIHLLFNEDDKAITAINIFKVCLRLRPDRIFLSELRGAEAWPFLRAANSGHPGSISTVHADTPQGCIDQLVFMLQQAGSNSPEQNIRSYLKSVIPIIIQLKRSSTPEQFMVVSDIYFNYHAP